MKSDKYVSKQKQYIKAKTRLDEIWKEMRSRPWTKLKEPYQSGWRLIVTLRDDFMRSDKGPVVKELIDRFKVDLVIRDAKAISDIRKRPNLADVRSRLAGKHKYQAYAPSIRSLDERTYKSLSEQQRKYFTFHPKTSLQYRDEYHLNIPSHYLVIRVEKRIITHTKDIDRALLKEEAELKKILEPYWRSCGYNEGYYHLFENRKERRKAKVELQKEVNTLVD